MTTDTKAVARWGFAGAAVRAASADKDGDYVLFTDHERVVGELGRVRIELARAKVQIASMQFHSSPKLPRPLEDLRDATQHVIDCADGGDDYAYTRPMIDALTVLGILEKTGRGLWSANLSVAQATVSALTQLQREEIARPSGIAEELPPLPQEVDSVRCMIRGEKDLAEACDYYYNAEQMRDYARTALAASRAEVEGLKKAAKRWGHARKLLTVDDIFNRQRELHAWQNLVSEEECERADKAIDAAMENNNV